MKKFSEQTGRSFFIDGEALQKEADFDFDLKAKDVLDKIADAFDYSWSLSRHQVILLNKRFENPDELPQMRLREMRRMAKDILTFWPASSSEARSRFYPFDHRSIYAGNGLYRTLTPDQLAFLQSGQRLDYEHLSPEQQHIVQLGINNEFLGITHDMWETLDACMNNLPRSILQFRLWHGRPDIPGSDNLNNEWGSLDCIWSNDPHGLNYYRVALHPTESEQNERGIKAAQEYSKQKEQEKVNEQKK